NMCLNFLDDYIRQNEIPERLVDVNIASDYSKLEKMLDLCQDEERENIIKKTIEGEGILAEITEKFNPAVDFTLQDFCSMLFYLGYLTIQEEVVGYTKLGIQNKVMKEIYAELFLNIMQIKANIDINKQYSEITKQIALDGKIDKV